MSDPETTVSGETPLFLLSFRQRDELATAVANAGWNVVAARRGAGVERRLLASGAAVALIDARGAIDDGLAATRALGGIVAANGGALLVLVSRNDAARLGEFHDAGATHFLTSPMRANELVQALRFAERHVQRLGGWQGAASGPAEPLGWRYDPALRSLQLTPGLAMLVGLSESPKVRELAARVARAERPLLRGALRRLASAPSTAFAHELAGAGRVVQHLQRDPRTGRLHALVEILGAAPDASAVVRDVLTGARDETSARRWLERRLERGGVGAILIGLTRFETVNAVHGRAAGDALLRTASRRIADAARELLGRSAIVARMGGPEFLAASDDIDPERLAIAAARIEEAVTRPFVVGGAMVSLGARITTAVGAPGDEASALLRRLSEALHDGRAEAAGADEVSLDTLAGDILRAMEEGELDVLFQPQVAVSTRTIVGAEALARWHHPRLGEIGPETLFAAAERAGLDVTLSAHVQRLALDTAARWPASLSQLRLSINVTAADVARSGFADTLLDRVDASGFPRRRLTVEIVESGLIEELGEAARLLAELRSAGCRVAIDDFGTGYSSLAYLKALPLDYLKIDKKLSQDITGSPRDRVVVRGVIDMARSLGLSVVAEGVETEQQLELLAKDGCQYYQGFLCAPPIDVAALTALVER